LPESAAPLATGPLPAHWVDLLFEVSRQFASSLELDEVLGKVLHLTVEAVQANEGSLFLLDRDGRVNRSILASKDLLPQVKQPIVAAVMSKGLAGWAYQHRQVGLIADTRTDSRWHPLPHDKFLTRSAMAVPLLRRDLVIGLLTLTHPEPNRFRKSTIGLVEAIAAQAASAIENAALYTRVNSERALLGAIIAGVEDVILVTDSQDQLLLANPAAQRSLGLGPSAQRRPIAEVLSEPALLDVYRKVVETADAGQTSHKLTLRDGRVFDCALVTLPAMGGAGGGRVLTLHDVTTFERLNALKSEFVSHVAHDLKSPLATIHGYAWLLDESTRLTEEEREFAQQIMRSINRMRALIDNLLDIGRIEMGIEAEFQSADVAAIARSALAQWQTQAHDKRVTLSEELGEDMPPVNCSPIRLEQAVSNLIGNAIKFTPAGGRISVRAAMEAGQVVVRVTDTGPGIPAPLQARLFQKFSRLGREATAGQEGHGLGLAIVKSIVEAHGGRAWVESQPDQGSTFAFALPAKSNS
jgi:signal transduction histidine kinase